MATGIKTGRFTFLLNLLINLNNAIGVHEAN